MKRKTIRTYSLRSTSTSPLSSSPNLRKSASMSRSWLLTIAFLLAAFLSTANCLSCGQTESEPGCFGNRNCTWDNGCAPLEPLCHNRTRDIQCRRDGKCVWDSVVSVCMVATRTPELLACATHISVRACEEAAACEFDILTSTCIEDRARTCNGSTGAAVCSLTLGCAWTTRGCVAWSRDYSVLCGIDCSPGVCDTVTCDVLPKNKSQVSLQWLCNQNTDHPFLRYCTGSACSDSCAVKDPVCEVVPLAIPYTCHLDADTLCPSQGTKPRCNSLRQCTYLPKLGCVSFRYAESRGASNGRLGEEWGLAYAMIMLIGFLVPIVLMTALSDSRKPLAVDRNDDE